jgi:stage III sporulation protein AA
LSINKKEEIIRLLSASIRKLILNVEEFDNIYEIRIRTLAPVIVMYREKDYFLAAKGGITREEKEAYWATKEDIDEVLEYISSYSMYAFEDETLKRKDVQSARYAHPVGVQ